jgi:hypothetical protein
MVAVNGDESIKIRTISPPNFEVSCAEGSPSGPGYWFGSDDGRIQFVSSDGVPILGPYAIAPSEEAVNGIAIARGLMAVSTRSDITFLKTPALGDIHIARTVFQGGAHGVVGTSGGCIIAPMGQRGILLMDPKMEMAPRVRILRPPNEALYIYKAVSLASPDGREIAACAGRRGGLATLPLAGAGLENHGKKLRPVGVDFVDIASLDVDGFPFAVAALGLDCSIHFASNLLGDPTTTALHLSLRRERAYRILCAEGHVFMLTDKGLYAFKDLAVRFLRGEAINDPIVRWLEMEAVDAFLGPDRSLLVVMPDTVYQPMIDTILAGGHLRMPLLRSDDELIEPFDETAWEQSEELELADVA